MIFKETALRRRFATTAAIILVGFFVWVNVTTKDVPLEHRAWSTLIFLLAAFPAINWALKSGEGYPAFQVLCLSLIPTQALPLLTKTEELRQFSEDTIREAALVVMCFQVTLIVVYNSVKAVPKRSPFWTEPIIERNIANLLSTTLTCSTIYVVTTSFFYAAPSGIEGPLRAIFSGLSAVSAYTLANYYSGDELPRHLRAPLIINVATQALTFASSLIMVQGITLVITTLLGYLSRATRIPWLAILAVVGLVALLHTGKAAMREKYWADDRRGTPLRFVDVPSFYSEWIETAITTAQMSEEDLARTKRKDNNKLLQRSSLFHMLCLVVEYSPSRQDFLYGKTYFDLPAQFVPRFFWPNKPKVHVSTSMLGVYYGLQDEDATQTTTIGFGFLAESWANFGLVGCIALGALFGAMHKTFWTWTRFSELFSPAGILMITFTAWSFETGQTMSVWTSSFYQAAVVLMFSTVAIKQFFNG